MKENVPKPQRRNYYILILSVVSMQITSSTIYMVLPLFFEQFGITKSENGILISVGTLAGIVSGLAAGKLSDSHGRKIFLVIGTVLYSLVFFMFVLMGHDFNTLFVLRFVEGFGFYIVPVIITAMAADIFPPSERGKAMGLYSLSFGIGGLIGPLITPLLVRGNDFSTYFIFSGIFVFISAVIMMFFVKETFPPETRSKARIRGKGYDVRDFLTSVKGLGVVVGIFLIAVLLYRIGYTMIDPFFSLYLQDVLHSDITSISYLYALRAIFTIIFSPLAGFVVDRYGRKPTYMVGMALTIVTLIGYNLMGSFTQVVILRALLDGASSTILLTSIRAYMADLLSPETMGFGMGLHSAITQQSSTLGSMFSGYMIDLYGYGTIFLTAAATALLALIIVLRWVPEPPKNMQKDRD
jgi:DHA1 family multidrug resistance protein-like MFS transporter